MHNCKTARSSFIDLALHELAPARSRELLAELNACPGCREEYAALDSALHVSRQALRSASPGEAFWPGYHDRLRLNLQLGSALESERVGDRAPKGLAKTSRGVELWLVMRNALMASIRVPVSAALALSFLFLIAGMSLRSRTPESAIPAMPSAAVVTRTVTVPVVQEKVITHVVYLERKSSRKRHDVEHQAQPNNANNLASTAPAGSSKSALNLVGFVPTDQVKLTVIKGSYRDEK